MGSKTFNLRLKFIMGLVLFAMALGQNPVQRCKKTGPGYFFKGVSQSPVFRNQRKYL